GGTRGPEGGNRGDDQGPRIPQSRRDRAGRLWLQHRRKARGQHRRHRPDGRGLHQLAAGSAEPRSPHEIPLALERHACGATRRRVDPGTMAHDIERAIKSSQKQRRSPAVCMSHRSLQLVDPVMSTSPKRAAKKFTVPKELGDLPEWNLSDLYAGVDDPKVKRDLDRSDEYSKAFEDDFKGKLAALLDQPDGGIALAQAIVRYEQLDDLLGRLASFAGL